MRAAKKEEKTVRDFLHLDLTLPTSGEAVTAQFFKFISEKTGPPEVGLAAAVEDEEDSETPRRSSRKRRSTAGSASAGKKPRAAKMGVDRSPPKGAMSTQPPPARRE